jgi:hypothetical protein
MLNVTQGKTELEAGLSGFDVRPVHWGFSTLGHRHLPLTQHVNLRDPFFSSVGHPEVQFCIPFQVPIRLYGDSRNLNSFTASLHLQ